MPRDVSLRQIAERSGVSISTVSRVLNDQRGISDDTRERVFAAARELRFFDARNDPGLGAKETTIAVVAYKKPFPARMITASHDTVGVYDEAQRNGLHVLTVLVTDEDMKSAASLPVFREGRADGFVLIGPTLPPSFILDVYKTGKPIVLVDTMLKNTPIDCVLHENEGPIRELTESLLKLGHRELLFLSGPSEWVSSAERMSGFKQAVLEAGVEPRVVSMHDTTIETGREASEVGLSKYPNTTAIVAVNDAVAIGAAQHCSKQGKTTPEDISITGFDDIQWAELHHPPLTTVRTHPEEMGRQAARRLADVLGNPEPEHVRLRLRVDAQPVYRNSTGPPRS